MSPYVGCVVGPNLAVGQAPFAPAWDRTAFVEACRHEVWEHVFVQPDHSGRANEVCVRCQACNAPRCGSSTDADPCMRIRHHGDTVVVKSKVADLVLALDQQTHLPYSDYMVGLLPPTNATTDDLERWLEE